METVILIEKKRNALTAIRDMHKRAAIAQMAELVDAPASGAGVLTDVEVRVLFWAPFHSFISSDILQFFFFSAI